MGAMLHAKRGHAILQQQFNAHPLGETSKCEFQKANCYVQTLSSLR